MDDERFVSDVDDAADAVAGVEGRRRPRVVLDRSVVVAVLDLLQTKHSVTSCPAIRI